MPEVIVYVDRSDIRAGKLEAVKEAAARLVAFVDAHEPQLIAYSIHVDDESSTMSVVAVHPDSESMLFHMEIGGPEFRKFADLIDLRSIDVYGRPSDAVVEQLHDKARMLGEGGRVVVHEPQAAFARGFSAG